MLMCTFGLTLLTLGHAKGQWIYSVGVDEVTLGPQLQRIHLQSHQVVKVTDLSQPLGDIAFHPDGTLYGVYIDRFYEVDTTSGDVVSLPGFPSITFMTGLTIDHKGVFYVSAGADAGKLFRYDPVAGAPVLMGVIYNHMDAAFYNGELYVAGILPESFGERSHITRVDTTDFSKSEIIVQYEKWPGLALASHSDPCGSQYLVSPTIGYLNYFFPPVDSLRQITMPQPMNFQSAGAASRMGYLGSLPPLAIDHLDVIQNPCDTSGIATIQVIAKPGREQIEYSLNGVDFQSSYVFTEVLPGTYQVYLRDALGCSDVSDPFRISPVVPVEVAVQTTSAHCHQDNGEAYAEPSGGSGGWIYAIDGGIPMPDSIFTGLTEGLHTIRVTDKNGCTAEIEFEIDAVDPLAFSYTVEPEICSMDNASIAITAYAGAAPYTYTLMSMGTQDHGNFAGLQAGTYSAVVEDALGCRFEKSITIPSVGGPEVTEIRVEKSHCGMADGSFELTATGNGPLIYSLNGGTFTDNASFANVGAGQHVITVKDVNGCETVVGVIVEEVVGPAITGIEIIDATCDEVNGSLSVSADGEDDVTYSINGTTFGTDNHFSGLDAGSYMVWIQDAYGCRDSMQVTMAQTGSPEITGVFEDAAYCGLSNGEIVVYAEGGVGDLYYTLNGGQEGRSPLFTELTSGTYTVTVRDENYCTVASEAEVPESDGIALEHLDVVPADCGAENGQVTFATNSIPLAAASLDGTPVGGTSIDNVSPGEHELWIEGVNGCKVSRQFVVPQNECGIYVPNIFSPNDDGVNDVFDIIYDRTEYTLHSMRIADRWGAVIIDCSGACNWDGRLDGSEEHVASGVYIYSIILTDFTGEQFTFSGDVTVVN